jgi:hypothetical protein
MAIVKVIKDGNCTISFDDKYCLDPIKDAKKIQDIIDAVGKIYSDIFSEHPEDFKE